MLRWLRRNRIWFYSSVALRFYSVSKRYDATRCSAQRHIVNQALGSPARGTDLGYVNLQFLPARKINCIMHRRGLGVLNIIRIHWSTTKPTAPNCCTHQAYKMYVHPKSEVIHPQKSGDAHMQKHVCVHTKLCICSCICMYVYMHACAYKRTCTWVTIHTYARTYI